MGRNGNVIIYSQTVLAAPRGMIPSLPFRLIGIDLIGLLGDELRLAVGDVDGPASFVNETEWIEVDMNESREDAAGELVLVSLGS